MLKDTNTSVMVLLESVSKHAYEKIVVAPKNVIITSPYLTSDTAETVIGAADPNTSTILTTFQAEIFAAKASSLSTLRALIQKGFDLRYLDGLHAKIVLTRDACFVGSQNLTVGGTLNKEATALVTDPSTVAAVADGLHAWVKHSQPIRLEMIDDMEKEIGPLIASSDKLATAVNAVDQTVRAAESRRLEIRRRLEEAKQRQEEQRKREELLRHAREILCSVAIKCVQSTHSGIGMANITNSRRPILVFGGLHPHGTRKQRPSLLGRLHINKAGPLLSYCTRNR